MPQVTVGRPLGKLYLRDSDPIQVRAKKIPLNGIRRSIACFAAYRLPALRFVRLFYENVRLTAKIYNDIVKVSWGGDASVTRIFTPDKPDLRMEKAEG